MSKHVVVGAGAVGRGVARVLSGDGHEVVIVSGSGRAPRSPGVRAVAADATDGTALATLAAGADAIYNCANPSEYNRWASEWPPLAASLLHAAELSGAGLVTMSNLYIYGEVIGPIRPTDALSATGTKGRIRKQMWEDALAAHRAGRLRATEARASDFIGAESGAQSHLGDRVIPRVLAGKSVRVLGSADAVHSWTYVPDVSRTLATLGTDDRSWGRAWHVPSNPPMTQREAIASIAAAAGVAMPRVGSLSRPILRVVGVVAPVVRELPEVLHQFEHPFVIDATETTATFGIEATPWADVVTATLAGYGVSATRPTVAVSTNASFVDAS